MNVDPFKAMPLPLKGNAKIYYDHVLSTYQLTVPEMSLLHDICQEMMLIAEFRFELAQQDNISVGSVGQERANPLIAEIARHSTLMLSYIKQLNLPVDNDDSSSNRAKEEMSAKMRELGKKRWANSG